MIARTAWGMALTLVAVGAAPAAQRARTAPASAVPGSAPAKQKLTASAQRGLEFLRKGQESDGSWNHYPGVTALCLLAFLRTGVSEKDPAVARAAGFLAQNAKSNGAIFTEALGPAQALPNYNTSLSMAALNATGNPKYRLVVKAAQRYLETSQYDEGEGYTKKDAQYGGMGYGRAADNPDLSNLQNALEALKETGYPQNGPAFQKAIQFIERCQNRKESNDQAWAGNDGGFIYAARGESKADEYTKQPHSSYGSMTYAGLKSYLYCGVSKDDPRARAAYAWLRGNYSVEENPRMKDDGLFYYYHTMSKTLAVYGSKTLTDSAGRKHYWGVDLVNALAGRQQPDGSWKNQNARWQESNPILATAYAVISLANCQKGL